jgi:GDP-4-dehydro-6-deoxy-D-mannose reductase
MGDNSKLRAATGWEPTIEMTAIVAEILDYWRDRLQETSSAGAA